MVVLLVVFLMLLVIVILLLGASSLRFTTSTAVSGYDSELKKDIN